MTDPLQKLLMQNGMVSSDFPEHLGELFAMDGKHIFTPNMDEGIVVFVSLIK